MAQDYSEYLAIHVINERKPVSFRTVSRALKVHANIAKQMLYDFHHRQNSKKPGSVHATYLITGIKHPQQTNGTQDQDGEDTVMQSDPVHPGSSMPGQDEAVADAVRARTMTLAREEHLEQAKAGFEQIIGIHVYSLQTAGLSEMQVLTECNRSIAADYASEDPSKVWRQYGTIQNPHVRRRIGAKAPPPTQPANPSETKAKSVAAATKPSAPAKPQSTSQPASQESKPDVSKPAASKPSHVKRQDSSLFKSFAKASAKPKKPAESDDSAAPTPGPDSQDASMTGFSDDDDDDEDPDSALPAELQDVKVPGGKSRKEREAELQAMMDREDETMADANDGSGEHEDTDAKNEDDDDNDEGEEEEEEEEAGETGAIDGTDAKKSDAPQQQENVTVENGRRRGRRRVMKKKTVKDEEGYLVTKEEPAWESFSEEEPAPKKPKVEATASGAKAGGKKAAKPGQGNIMSFFAKR